MDNTICVKSIRKGFALGNERCAEGRIIRNGRCWSRTRGHGDGCDGEPPRAMQRVNCASVMAVGRDVPIAPPGVWKAQRAMQRANFADVMAVGREGGGEGLGATSGTSRVRVRYRYRRAARRLRKRRFRTHPREVYSPDLPCNG